jgi:hypothetical protein
MSRRCAVMAEGAFRDGFEIMEGRIKREGGVMMEMCKCDDGDVQV